MDARRLKTLAFKAVSLVFLMVICCTVIAQGLRLIHPLFTGRLARIPGLRFLERWEGWHRLDLANVVAVVLLVVEYVILVKAVRYFLVPASLRDSDDWNARNDRTITWVGFVGFVLFEGFLFFLGVLKNDSGWDEGSSVFVGVVGTFLYTMSIVFVAYLTVNLERRS